MVEKILGRDEQMPAEWPVAGTTGYEFLNTLNGIFVKPEGLDAIEADLLAPHRSVPVRSRSCATQANKQVMQDAVRGRRNALTNHLAAISARHRHARDVRLSELTEMLVEVTACLPVYRTYIHELEVSRTRTAATSSGHSSWRGSARRPNRSPTEAFEFLRSVLLLEPPPYLEERESASGSAS